MVDGRDKGGAVAGEGNCGRGAAYCRCRGGVAVIAVYGWLQYSGYCSCEMPSIRGAPPSMEGRGR